jgi:hypothetical protein
MSPTPPSPHPAGVEAHDFGAATVVRFTGRQVALDEENVRAAGEQLLALAEGGGSGPLVVDLGNVSYLKPPHPAARQLPGWQGPFSLVGHAPCRFWPGKGAFLDKPDLSYVRELLASTEALLKDVEAGVAEARRLHEQARMLHGQQPAPPLTPSRRGPQGRGVAGPRLVLLRPPLPPRQGRGGPALKVRRCLLRGEGRRVPATCR